MVTELEKECPNLKAKKERARYLLVRGTVAP
jgi:hypothetical protein